MKAGPKPLNTWDWDEFNNQPQTKVTCDIHCVPTWSRLDTAWEGVIVDDLPADAGVGVSARSNILAHLFDGYSANVPLKDVIEGKAMVALQYEGRPLSPDHGRPARLLVPHVYF